VADREGGSAVGFTEFGVFDGVVIAGVAGGRVGGAGCHNAGLYTVGGGEKRAGDDERIKSQMVAKIVQKRPCYTHGIGIM